MNHSLPTKKSLITFTLLLFITVFCSSCSDTKNPKSHIKTIASEKQLDRITARAKDRLLLLDFFDERCMSCCVLLAQLEDLAKEQKDKVTIYKVNVGKNPEIAKIFNVTRRPYVVFIKNKKGVHAITGLQSKETFVEAIEKYAKEK